MSTDASANASPILVVGVSKRGSREALAWAAAVAGRTGGRVRAVMAWRPPRPPAAPGGHPPAVHSTGPDDPAVTAKDQLDQLVVAALGADHGVECVAVRGGAVRALLAAAADADLLVVDSPRPGKLANMSTKLVAPQLIYRSPCPVVVMPAPASDPHTAPGLRRSAGRFAAALATAAAGAGRAGIPPIQPSRGGDQA